MPTRCSRGITIGHRYLYLGRWRSSGGMRWVGISLSSVWEELTLEIGFWKRAWSINLERTDKSTGGN